jgi:hypothetical protein
MTLSENRKIGPLGVPFGTLNLGATQHFDPRHKNFTTYSKIAPIPITSADSNTFYAIGCGDVPVMTQWDSQLISFMLKNVLHAPDMLLALMSVHFKHDGAHVYTPDHQLLFKVKAKNGLYPLTGQPMAALAAPAITSKSATKMSLMDLHQHMGHTNCHGLLDMV